jgi:hypothetical protein
MSEDDVVLDNKAHDETVNMSRNPVAISTLESCNEMDSSNISEDDVVLDNKAHDETVNMSRNPVATCNEMDSSNMSEDDVVLDNKAHDETVKMSRNPSAVHDEAVHDESGDESDDESDDEEDINLRFNVHHEAVHDESDAVHDESDDEAVHHEAVHHEAVHDESDAVHDENDDEAVHHGDDKADNYKLLESCYYDLDDKADDEEAFDEVSTQVQDVDSNEASTPLDVDSNEPATPAAKAVDVIDHAVAVIGTTFITPTLLPAATETTVPSYTVSKTRKYMNFEVSLFLFT